MNGPVAGVDVAVARAERVARWMEMLSLEEKCAQLLVARPIGDAFDRRDAAAEIGVGGYIVHPGMTDEPDRMAAWIEDAQAHAAARTGIPLLVCADHEGGHVRVLRGRATELPPNMGLGATGDPASAREAAAILGAELRTVGVNWVLAPVVDVNSDPANPVIGVRSYGDDPATVGAFAKEAVAGFQGEGILACAKHFPGHGDTNRDSHLTLPTIRHGRARLDRVELPPFREAIAAGVATVMSAHLAVPALDPLDISTLSHATLSGLLRGELGFAGVIVTDAMEMHGVADLTGVGDAAVRAVAAGADLVLAHRDPDLLRETHAALVAAVRSGRLSAARLDAAAGRALAAKARVADVRPDRARLSEVGSPAHRARANALARGSITIVRDDEAALPLARGLGSGLLVIGAPRTTATMTGRSIASASSLGEEIARLAPGARELGVTFPPSDAERRAIVDAARAAAVVVATTMNASSDPAQVALLEAIRESSGARLVVVATRSPYDLLVLPWVRTFVCAYTSVGSVPRAVAEVLFGERRATGRLPVAVPGLYPRGHRA